jgi:hypothetical protein
MTKAEMGLRLTGGTISYSGTKWMGGGGEWDCRLRD